MSQYPVSSLVSRNVCFAVEYVRCPQLLFMAPVKKYIFSSGPLRVMGDLVHRGRLWVKDIPNLDLVNPLLANENQQQVITGKFSTNAMT